MNKSCKRALLVGASLAIVVGCATTPDTSRYVPAPQGSSWVWNVRQTGSFGAKQFQATRTMKTADWEGRQVQFVEGPPLSLFIDENGCQIAQAAGTKPVMRFEPPLCGANRPWVVGATVARKFKVHLLQSNRTVDVDSRSTWEAYEEVSVPAGTFMAYRSKYTDNFDVETTTWWEPEHTISVKSISRRGPNHPSGPGTQETELVSLSLKR